MIIILDVYKNIVKYILFKKKPEKPKGFFSEKIWKVQYIIKSNIIFLEIDMLENQRFHKYSFNNFNLFFCFEIR
jgi:phosphatidylserine decarboxylase